MAAVLRVVHPSELANCSCQRPAPPLLWLDVEEKPRCHACLKLVQDFSRIRKTDRAAARWICFIWISWTSWRPMILYDCRREAFAVGSQTVTTSRGDILLDLCSPLFSL